MELQGKEIFRMWSVYDKPTGKLALSLIPITKISGEDAIEVARIITQPDVVAEWKVDERMIVGVSLTTGGDTGPTVCIGKLSPADAVLLAAVNFMGNQYGITNTSHAIDYLRSKGYDCGYMHIPSLIEAGYAVEKVSEGVLVWGARHNYHTYTSRANRNSTSKQLGGIEDGTNACSHE